MASELWELVLPDKLQVGDVIAKHCSETPQIIETIELAIPPASGFSDAFIVNDNRNRPLLGWMPVYRRYTGPSPEVLMRALEIACIDKAETDSQFTEYCIELARRELEQERTDGPSDSHR